MGRGGTLREKRRPANGDSLEERRRRSDEETRDGTNVVTTSAVRVCARTELEYVRTARGSSLRLRLSLDGARRCAIAGQFSLTHV